jgi:hypothetical protein
MENKKNIYTFKKKSYAKRHTRKTGGGMIGRIKRRYLIYDEEKKTVSLFYEVKKNLSELNSYIYTYNKDSVSESDKVNPKTPKMIGQKWGVLNNFLKITSSYLKEEELLKKVMTEILKGDFELLDSQDEEVLNFLNELKEFYREANEKKINTNTAMKSEAIMNGSEKINFMFALLLQEIPKMNIILTRIPLGLSFAIIVEKISDEMENYKKKKQELADLRLINKMREMEQNKKQEIADYFADLVEKYKELLSKITEQSDESMKRTKAKITKKITRYSKL